MLTIFLTILLNMVASTVPKKLVEKQQQSVFNDYQANRAIYGPMTPDTQKWLLDLQTAFAASRHTIFSKQDLLDMQETTQKNLHKKFNSVAKEMAGTHEVRMIEENDLPTMYWSRSLKNAHKKKLPMVMIIHGGGGVQGSGPYIQRTRTWTESLEIIAMNLDYHLAPNFKIPTQQEDIIKGLQYAIDNAEQLGIDTSRICVYAESAGATFTLGALTHQTQMKSKIKLLVMFQPMLGDFINHQRPIYEQNGFEEQYYPYLKEYQKYWMPEDLKDPTLMFPYLMTQDQINNLPNSVIITSEYDIFRDDAYDFADKLKISHKLLDFCDYQGVTHAFDLFQDQSDIAIQKETDLGKIFTEYLFK